MISETAKNVVEANEDDYENMKFDLFRVMAVEIPFSQKEMKDMRTELKRKKWLKSYFGVPNAKPMDWRKLPDRLVKDVYEKQGAMYENILIPISDGKRYNITTNLKGGV